jgi:hypothetical protein
MNMHQSKLFGDPWWQIWKRKNSTISPWKEDPAEMGTAFGLEAYLSEQADGPMSESADSYQQPVKAVL